jgi:NADH-quinone oxidoreductase subunit I
MLGTLKSLMTTIRIGFHKKFTVEYPTERPVLAPRFMAHPVLTWDEEVHEPYCTGCLICMRICPTDVITVSMKDNPKFAEQESTRRKIVDDFELNVADCIMCGLCVDYCNFDAIVMSDNFDISKQSRTQLVQGLEKLLDGGRDQVARGRWSPPETKKSQRRSAAQGRTAAVAGDGTAAAPAVGEVPAAVPTTTAQTDGDVDPRVAAGRAKAAEMRAQRDRDQAANAAGAGVTATEPALAIAESEGGDTPSQDPRVVESRRKAAEMRAQRARERGEDPEAAIATPLAPQSPSPEPDGAQAATDPRVLEGRRKAAEMRAQRARERGEDPEAAVVTPPPTRPTDSGSETVQPSTDPRVIESRRKAAELRAQRAREREEQENAKPDEAGLQ